MAMSPQYESYSVSESDMSSGSGIFLYISYSGVTSTCGGSRLPAVKTMSSGRPKRNRIRVMVNATNEARNSTATRLGAATMTVFVKYFGSSAWSHTCL
jgi:hypothetical protein